MSAAMQQCPECLDTGWVDVDDGHGNKSVRRCPCRKSSDRGREMEQRRRHMSRRAREQRWSSFDEHRTHLYDVTDGVSAANGERRVRFSVLRNWRPAGFGTEEEGNGLFGYGLPRVGKTHAANAIANGLIEAGIAALAWNIGDLMEAEYEAIREETRRPLTDAVRAPVLVLDDLGAARPKSYAVDYLLRLIDQREKEKLPTLYFSNLDLAGLARHLDRPIGTPAEVETARQQGARIMARIRELSTRVFRFEKVQP
jgi:DNA replication protein DnaC